MSFRTWILILSTQNLISRVSINYNNSYKWLSVASAFDIPNTQKARERIFRKVSKEDLTEIQEDSNNVYTSIASLIKADKNGELKWSIM